MHLAGDRTTTSPETGLREPARRILFEHLRPAGHTVPNAATYPWQWLWDSAFHAVAWNVLGHPEHAIRELEVSLDPLAVDGFVPHVQYHGPSPHESFWNRRATSSITQPPMFGHAIAELVRSGVEVPGPLVERAVRSLTFLLDRRARIDGLVTVVHPWETGADDSPRWEQWCAGPFTVRRWFDVKGNLLRSIVRSSHGSPLGNDLFRSAPASFNALVAFNALELVEVIGDPRLASQAGEIVDALDEMWDPDCLTWADAGDARASSGRIRTLDGLLPVLVSRRATAVVNALDQAIDPHAFGGAYGPLGVHRDEPSFDPGAYWRGGTWPQLAYLIWLGAVRQGEAKTAHALATHTALGAVASGFAEYWDGDTGATRGAAPQSWTSVVVAMEPGRT
jgi:hypothetical protein